MLSSCQDEHQCGVLVQGFRHPVQGDRIELGETEQSRLQVLNQLQRQAKEESICKSRAPVTPGF